MNLFVWCACRTGRLVDLAVCDACSGTSVSARSRAGGLECVPTRRRRARVGRVGRAACAGGGRRQSLHAHDGLRTLAHAARAAGAVRRRRRRAAAARSRPPHAPARRRRRLAAA